MDLAHRWWMGVLASPDICKTTGQILDPKVAFDVPAYERSKYIAKLYLKGH